MSKVDLDKSANEYICAIIFKSILNFINNFLLVISFQMTYTTKFFRTARPIVYYQINCIHKISARYLLSCRISKLLIPLT